MTRGYKPGHRAGAGVSNCERLVEGGGIKIPL